MSWNVAWLVFLINLSSCQCIHAFHGERERDRDRDSQTRSFPSRHDSLNEFLRAKMFFEFDFCTGRTLTWDTRGSARCSLCLIFEKWSKLGMWTHCHCWIRLRVNSSKKKRLHVSIRQKKKKQITCVNLNPMLTGMCVFWSFSIQVDEVLILFFHFWTSSMQH